MEALTKSLQAGEHAEEEAIESNDSTARNQPTAQGAAPYGFAWGNSADIPIFRRP